MPTAAAFILSHSFASFGSKSKVDFSARSVALTNFRSHGARKVASNGAVSRILRINTSDFSQEVAAFD